MGKRSGSGITNGNSGGNAVSINSAKHTAAFDKLLKADDDQLAAIAKKAKSIDMPNLLSDVKDVTQRFVYAAELNDKPGVLDSSEFSTFMKNNNLTAADLLSRDVNDISYKNASGTIIHMTADDVTDMMMYSKYNYIGGKRGGQIYGAGTYFDHQNGGSTGYGKKTVVAVLNPAKARVVSAGGLKREAKVFAASHPKFVKEVGAYDDSWRGGNNNMSIYALAMGYNVISAGNGYMNVIDRSALIYRK